MQNKLKINSIAIIGGWVFSHFILTWFRYFEVGPFYVLPGFISTLYLLYNVTQNLLSSKSRALNYFALGIISESIPFWVMRVKESDNIFFVGPFDTNIQFFSLACLLVFIGLEVINQSFQRMKNSKTYQHPNISNMNIVIYSIANIGIIAAFRLSYFNSLDIPNRERSLFISDYEIHHAVLGTLVIVTLALTIDIVKKYRVLALMILTLGTSFILDQLLYLPQVQITDMAYNNTWSWMGALIGIIIFPVGMLRLRQRS